MKQPTNLRRRGFTLVELVIAMSLIAILVGVVAVRSGAFVERGQITKLVQLLETLKTACATYHVDTGAYPREYTNQAVANRQLSGVQTVTGWAGPYLEKPLAHNFDNPFGSLHVYNVVTANNWIPGFDLDGDGTLDVTSSANMLYLTGIEQNVAQKLDDSIDTGAQGDWTTTGRIRYDAGARRAYVLVYH